MANYLILGTVYFAVALWLFIGTFAIYVAAMKMREEQNKILQLHGSVRWACYTIIALGLVLDTLLNWIVLTPAFLEFPREFLSTSRVIRHKYHSTHWRQDRALWFCKHWLTPFDEKHCEK